MGQTLLLAKDVTDEPKIFKKNIADSNTGKSVGEVFLSFAAVQFHCLCHLMKVEFEAFIMPAKRARTMETYTAYEFERFEPIVGWGHDSPGHLLPTDPGRYCSGDGKQWSLKFDDVVPQLPPGFMERTPWSVFLGGESDTSGWEYGVDFNSHSWFKEQGKIMLARRRMWTREVISAEYEPPVLAETVSPAEAAAGSVHDQ